MSDFLDEHFIVIPVTIRTCPACGRRFGGKRCRCGRDFDPTTDDNSLDNPGRVD